MSNENIQKTKEEIMGTIFLKEEDTLQELKAIVDQSRQFFKIEKETGKIIFSGEIKLTIPDKILLLLIGRYIAKVGGAINNEDMKLAELSNELAIPTTSLSKPLGILVEEGIIRKTDDGGYKIIYHKIKETLQRVSK